MKLNKWTVGLAAVGVISLPAAVQAEETEMNVVNSMTSGTTISGYVNTSFHYNLNTANAVAPPGGLNRAAKSDGFNLDVVNLTIEKPLDESEWAAGYKAELWIGPDAVGYNPTINPTGDGNMDFAIKQAYVELRAPVGNGIDFKMGVFDTIIGYEAANAPANPNYTRSFGWSIEPTQHTGLLASYQINDIVSFSLGLAETVNSGINDRPDSARGTGAASPIDGKWDLSYLGAIAVTAPEDMGAMAGSTLYAGVVYGQNSATISGVAANAANYYVGATAATPVEGLSVGVAWDYLSTTDQTVGGSASIFGLYSSFQATEKLSLHARGEFGRINSGFNLQPTAGTTSSDVWSGTLTAQYDLWQNVITRLEYRWDNVDDGTVFGDTPGSGLYNGHAFMLNVIYVF